MIQLTSLYLLILFEGLFRSIVITKSINNLKITELPVFLLLIITSLLYSFIEILLIKDCINYDTISELVRNCSLVQNILLFLFIILVNFSWINSIYNKFGFWKFFGITAAAGYISAFNDIIIQTVFNDQKCLSR